VMGRPQFTHYHPESKRSHMPQTERSGPIAGRQAGRSLRDQFRRAGMGPPEKRCRVRSDMMVQPSHRATLQRANWHVRCVGHC
jgi:hypothetical protein